MDRELANKIGKTARMRRVHLRWTQEDVAERIGVTVEFYGRIERGVTLPSTPTLSSMTRALEISADELLGVQHPRHGAPKVAAASHQTNPAIHRLVRRAQRLDASALRLLYLLATKLARR